MLNIERAESIFPIRIVIFLILALASPVIIKSELFMIFFDRLGIQVYMIGLAWFVSRGFFILFTMSSVKFVWSWWRQRPVSTPRPYRR